MIQARELLQDAVLRTSLRAVADEVGVSHQTLADFLADPDKASKRTAELARRWAERQQGDVGAAEVGAAAGPPSDLLQVRLALVDGLQLDDWQKTLRLEVEIAAILADALHLAERASIVRAGALRAAEDAASERARAATAAEDAARERARAATAAEESAAARARTAADEAADRRLREKLRPLPEEGDTTEKKKKRGTG